MGDRTLTVLSKIQNKRDLDILSFPHKVITQKLLVQILILICQNIQKNDPHVIYSRKGGFSFEKKTEVYISSHYTPYIKVVPIKNLKNLKILWLSTYRYIYKFEKSDFEKQNT